VPELTDIVPEAPRKPYDMTKVIDRIVDEESFFEVQDNWARNVVIGFRSHGRTGARSASSPTSPA